MSLHNKLWPPSFITLSLMMHFFLQLPKSPSSVQDVKRNILQLRRCISCFPSVYKCLTFNYISRKIKLGFSVVGLWMSQSGCEPDHRRVCAHEWHSDQFKVESPHPSGHVSASVCGWVRVGGTLQMKVVVWRLTGWKRLVLFVDRIVVGPHVLHSKDIVINTFLYYYTVVAVMQWLQLLEEAPSY